MARTYSEADLLGADTTSEGWALAYVRSALRDVPNEAGAYPEDSFTDAEITAALAWDTVTDTTANGGDGSVYYRPHVTAARLLQSNPRAVVRWSVTGYSEERVPTSNVLAGIRARGSVIDDAIITATSGRIGQRGASVVF